MQGKALHYLITETAGSAVVNGLLNLLAAYAIFHGQIRIPTTGPRSLVMDTIGETFLVTSLSVLVSSIVAGRRRRAGILPVDANGRRVRPTNLYVRAVVIGLLFTALCVPLNALLLPRIFPDGVRLASVIVFKTVYGAILGAIATMLAVRRALREVDA